MSTQYLIKTLLEVSLLELLPCFNLAFSDYNVPIQVTAKELQDILNSNFVDPQLSFVAFDASIPVGFIINSIQDRQGEKFAFDAATAIIPEYRGKGVFSCLLQHTEKQLVENQVYHYYLEVLQQNTKAIELYKKKGFSIIRDFVLMRKAGRETADVHGCVQQCTYDTFKDKQVSHIPLIPPSCGQSAMSIAANSTLYCASYLVEDNKIRAYCIHDKVGRICQFAYSDVSWMIPIIKKLANQYDSLSAKNIDTCYSELIDVLLTHGFEEYLYQHEMHKQLG